MPSLHAHLLSAESPPPPPLLNGKQRQHMHDTIVTYQNLVKENHQLVANLPNLLLLLLVVVANLVKDQVVKNLVVNRASQVDKLLPLR